MDPYQPSNDENFPCSKCGKVPQGLLLLICGHHLCLPCSLENLRQQTGKGSSSFQSVLCEICNTTTVLDPESLEELRSLETGSTGYVNSKGSRSEQNLSARVSSFASPASPYFDLMTPCESHPEEAAKYFCLDCNARPVCSECVLTGAHASHHALHAKKAYPIIRGKTDDLMQGMVTRIEELEIASKGLDAHINSLAHHADGMKAQIKTLMEEVVAKLVKKEKEFETLIDGMLDDTIKSVESFKVTIRDRVETLSNNISVIRENMEGDLHAALVFYADNISSLQAVVDEEPIPREKYDSLVDNTEALMASINIFFNKTFQ